MLSSSIRSRDDALLTQKHGEVPIRFRATRRSLTIDTEQETIIINRSGRSTYPEEISVQTSGATPSRSFATLVSIGCFGEASAAMRRVR
jgi:hypothetical protein